jgi:hypothetical protein
MESRLTGTTTVHRIVCHLPVCRVGRSNRPLEPATPTGTDHGQQRLGAGTLTGRDRPRLP